MLNAQRPDPSELPTTSRLLRSTGIAAAVAAVLLTLVILPAEYGIDPTGIGRMLGLTQMGETKVALANEAEEGGPVRVAIETPLFDEATKASAPVADLRQDEMTVTLAADEAAEIKLKMDEGQTAHFVWSTNGPQVNFDTHGDGSGRDYHGYEKGTVARAEGDLTAAFDGSHGWFWRNRSGQPVTITLQVQGRYQSIDRVL